MKIPSFKDLDQEIREGRTGSWMCSGSGLHPNPRYWKYDWWVFHKDSAIDGREFLTKPYLIPTKKALELIAQIKSDEGLCWIYNVRRPRLDPVNTPFDPHHPRWDNVEWAPAYDQDLDEPIDGHK